MSILPKINDLEEIAGRKIAWENYFDFVTCCERFQINTRDRIAHFLAQAMHESGELRYMEEIASGEAYEGRKDLGNVNPGDGRKFKGAGPLQLTGRYNYQRFCAYIGDEKIIEIGAKYVAKKYPWTSAGFWWMDNRINKMIDKDATCREVSKRVNGKDPASGLKDREMYFKKVMEVLDGKI